MVLKLRTRPLVALLLAAIAGGPAAVVAGANTSHEGWPEITGVLIMNKKDQNTPIDARPSSGHVKRKGHNELLGGHGNDTINAGNHGDVIWGDYKPSGQPTTQIDRLNGGPGNDFIYAGHGYNNIRAANGNDWVKAHYGRGIIDCGGGTDILYVSRRAQGGYKIRNCETISHKTLGY
jgi:Ca2+-binding RTX toxin-like protein